ncbi:ribosomal-processing cysteine protease Prp [Treponema phagedenis]|uniref:ribosomal-processing cysteine protease Prp n=1 Tax=Treponema phagedenis TaxID=162 RepID=UPI0011EC4C25|nr:ribosomal-processing cysteine protease Prp [Treponema phagedenis]TYT79653.1 ribosomal-processing cysteine protease Prp [Treponema phagedenis]
MISVLLELGTRNEFFSVTASGHAETAPRGFDIVCAAVSVLLRTAVIGLSEVNPQVNTAERGFLTCTVPSYAEDSLARLQFTAEFLANGMKTLVKEYPEAVDFRVKKL